MSYAVKEMFVTLQGEGLQAGRRALFLRFSGCNLWSGREADRAGAVCRFCDTDFVGTDGTAGGRYADAEVLADTALALWVEGLEQPTPAPGHASGFIVITGGEPLLQLDSPLVAALKARGFTIAIETNGTLPAPAGIDWLCISPKAGTEIVQRSGDELKIVWPQAGIDPSTMEDWDFQHFLISPMDCADRESARRAAVDYVMAHPKWRLSTQTHKVLGIR